MRPPPRPPPPAKRPSPPDPLSRKLRGRGGELRPGALAASGRRPHPLDSSRPPPKLPGEVNCFRDARVAARWRIVRRRGAPLPRPPPRSFPRGEGENCGSCTWAELRQRPHPLDSSRPPPKLPGEVNCVWDAGSMADRPHRRSAPSPRPPSPLVPREEGENFASRRRCPVPSPSPTQFVGEGRGRGAPRPRPPSASPARPGVYTLSHAVCGRGWVSFANPGESRVRARRLRPSRPHAVVRSKHLRHGRSATVPDPSPARGQPGRGRAFGRVPGAAAGRRGPGRRRHHAGGRDRPVEPLRGAALRLDGRGGRGAQHPGGGAGGDVARAGRRHHGRAARRPRLVRRVHRAPTAPGAPSSPGWPTRPWWTTRGG